MLVALNKIIQQIEISKKQLEELRIKEENITTEMLLLADEIDRLLMEHDLLCQLPH